MPQSSAFRKNICQQKCVPYYLQNGQPVITERSTVQPAHALEGARAVRDHAPLKPRWITKPPLKTVLKLINSPCNLFVMQNISTTHNNVKRRFILYQTKGAFISVYARPRVRRALYTYYCLNLTTGHVILNVHDALTAW